MVSQASEPLMGRKKTWGKGFPSNLHRGSASNLYSTKSPLCVTRCKSAKWSRYTSRIFSCISARQCEPTQPVAQRRWHRLIRWINHGSSSRKKPDGRALLRRNDGAVEAPIPRLNLMLGWNHLRFRWCCDQILGKSTHAPVGAHGDVAAQQPASSQCAWRMGLHLRI